MRQTYNHPEHIGPKSEFLTIHDTTYGMLNMSDGTSVAEGTEECKPAETLLYEDKRFQILQQIL